MAIVLLEGFDHYNVDFVNSQLYAKGWSGVSVDGGRPGRLPYGPQSQSVTVRIDSGIWKFLPASYTEIIVGFGFQVITFPDAPGWRPIFNDCIGVDYLGRMCIGDGGTSPIAVGTSHLAANTWHYVEGKFSATTGELRLDGVSEIGSTAGSFGSPFSSASFQYQVLVANGLTVDDLYIIDPSTGINTDYLGDTCVETLYPVSDGTYTQWTPDVGTFHYQLVDEYQMDDDLTYVHSVTPSDKDSYGIGNPTLANTNVYGVQLNLGVRKNDAGTRTVAPLIRQSGTDYTGSAAAVTATYVFHSWLLNQDPTGSDWTYTTVNNDEYGIELVS